MSVTIKEIAVAAGVSRGTVDRVLHDREGVNPDVAEKIRQLAKSMGYLPNRAGKALAARKRPLVIGCFLPSERNAFFDEVIRGFRDAETELADYGVSIRLRTVRGYEEAVHLEGIRSLAAEGCTALCVNTVDTPALRECVDGLVAKHIPVVTVNNDLTGTGRLCYVGSDYLKSGRTAGELLTFVAREEARILIATGSMHIKGHNERIAGFSRVLRERGTPYRLVDIFETQDDEDHAYETALCILRAHPEVNCVYVAAAGAAGVSRAISELGLRESALSQNKRLWVITSDDIGVTKRLVRTGAVDFTICQEPRRQGSEAVRLLFDYFMGDCKTVPEGYITDTVIKTMENL